MLKSSARSCVVAIGESIDNFEDCSLGVFAASGRASPLIGEPTYRQADHRHIRAVIRVTAMSCLRPQVRAHIRSEDGTQARSDRKRLTQHQLGPERLNLGCHYQPDLKAGCGVVPVLEKHFEPLVAIYPKAAHEVAIVHLGTGDYILQNFVNKLLKNPLVIGCEDPCSSRTSWRTSPITFSFVRSMSKEFVAWRHRGAEFLKFQSLKAW